MNVNYSDFITIWSILCKILSKSCRHEFKCLKFHKKNDKIYTLFVHMPNERFIMTYPAPRHGLFAVFILVSLTLNLLFFVISNERQQKERYERSIQAEAVAIAEGCLHLLALTTALA